MKVAYVKDADQKEVSDTLAALLAESGALVVEHTPSHLQFEGLNPGAAYSFAKGGYAGTYQHVGERDVEVRLELAAVGPQRLFWRTVWGEILAVIAVFVWNPSDGSTWFWATVVLATLLLLAGLLYAGTWKSSREAERKLYERLVERLREQAPVLTQDEMEEREVIEDVEGILARREASGRRKLFARAGKGQAPPSADAKGPDAP